MSSLPFLSPTRGDARALSRSPSEGLAAAAGATFAEHDGWMVATRFGDDAEVEELRLTETVGFWDRSRLAKFELHGTTNALRTVLDAVGGGITVRAQTGTRAIGAWWCPVPHTRLLVVGADGTALRAALERAVVVAEASVAVADQTCGLMAVGVAGPACRELLAQLSAIDTRPASMPVGAFRPGSIARTPGYLLCEAPDRLLALVGWALGEYFWEVVADAADALGGGPVGTDALRAAGADA